MLDCCKFFTSLETAYIFDHPRFVPLLLHGYWPFKHSCYVNRLLRSLNKTAKQHRNKSQEIIMDFFNVTTDKACTLFLVRSSPRTQHPCICVKAQRSIRERSMDSQRTLLPFYFICHCYSYSPRIAGRCGSVLLSCSPDYREVWHQCVRVHARACVRVWHQCVRVHAASVRARACACVRARHQCVLVHARACMRVLVRPFSPEHSADVSESLPLGAASPPSPLSTYPDRCAAFLSSLPPTPPLSLPPPFAPEHSADVSESLPFKLGAASSMISGHQWPHYPVLCSRYFGFVRPVPLPSAPMLSPTYCTGISYATSYADVRHRMLTYDIVC